MRGDIIHGHAKHGGLRSPTYQSWDNMIGRCLRKKNPYFHCYGGAGIKICKRWLKFQNFLADMGVRPEGKTLDRFPDNRGNYEPGNCRWATRSQQQNNRSTNVLVTYKGETLTMTEWANRLGMPATTFIARIKRWSIERAFTEPHRRAK